MITMPSPIRRLPHSFVVLNIAQAVINPSQGLFNFALFVFSSPKIWMLLTFAPCWGRYCWQKCWWTLGVEREPTDTNSYPSTLSHLLPVHKSGTGSTPLALSARDNDELWLTFCLSFVPPRELLHGDCHFVKLFPKGQTLVPVGHKTRAVIYVILIQ